MDCLVQYNTLLYLQGPGDPVYSQTCPIRPMALQDSQPIGKSGWRWYDRAEFISAEQDER
jgi:hypothetical protein